MMIQEQPPLPQPHMEERLLSFTLLSYGESKKVLQKLKIKEKQSMGEKTREFYKLNQTKPPSLTFSDLDFLSKTDIIKVKESQRQKRKWFCAYQ